MLKSLYDRLEVNAYICIDGEYSFKTLGNCESRRVIKPDDNKKKQIELQYGYIRSY